MHSQESDEKIIDIFKNGNVEIFKELVDKYTPLVFNFTAHMAGGTNAKDLTQEVFIKVWKNLKKFDPQKASFKTWIFTIAKNTAFDFLKKKKSILFSDITDPENEMEFSETIPDESPTPYQELEKLQNIELLNKLLNEIPPNYKTILILHYQEEMTFNEIGVVLNKPLNTVKSYHRRAIFLIREKLKNLHQK